MPNPRPLHVLVVEPETGAHSLLHDHVEAFGHRTRRVHTAEEGLLWLSDRAIDVIVFRVTRTGAAAVQQIRALRVLAAGAEVVLVANQNAVPAAVEAVRQGAFAYVTEPYRVDALELAVLRAGEMAVLRRTAGRYRGLTNAAHDLDPLVGSHDALRRIRDDARRVAATATPVLVTGEFGTGRALLGRHIHAQSDRAREPCCVVDCLGREEAQLETTLFGGHATAAAGGPAALQAADRGTVILRNVHALPAPLQTRLARVLETGEVLAPEGGPPAQVDVRIIATAPDERARARGGETMREELLYRLNAIDFHMPPLRERPEDIPDLVRHFLTTAPPPDGPREAHAAVLAVFARYRWPGNVWELRALVHRAAVAAEGHTITLGHMPELEPPLGEGEAAAAPLRLAEVERLHIERVLHHCRGNKTRAAQALGITPKTLYNKLHRYDASAGEPARTRRRGA